MNFGPCLSNGQSITWEKGEDLLDQIDQLIYQRAVTLRLGMSSQLCGGHWKKRLIEFIIFSFDRGSKIRSINILKEFYFNQWRLRGLVGHNLFGPQIKSYVSGGLTRRAGNGT